MKTLKIKLYTFDELSDTAKEKAIEKYRNSGSVCTDFIYDDAHQTVKKFNELFDVKDDRNSWLDFSVSHWDNNKAELKGLRLRKYILNNYGNEIFTRKYLKHGKLTENKPTAHPMRKIRQITQGPNKGLYSCSYYSNIQKEVSCPLTGVCYDNSILWPILELIEFKENYKRDYFSNLDFEALIADCFQELEKDIEEEVNYRNSDEAISEELSNNDKEYTQEGKEFLY